MTRARMTEQQEHDAGREGYVFRASVGIMAMLTAIGGFAALFLVEIPARNENAIMFALGAVFGWAGSVIASEYGASTTGRKVAESAIRSIERNDIATSGPSGTDEDPLKTVVVNTEQDPANVTEAKP